MTQLPLDDQAFFVPKDLVEAMRDSRYRHPALAVAELIDNSIDAKARHVDVLIAEQQIRVNTRMRWRVQQLAVLDDGHGMSPETLVQALRFGGRQPSKSFLQIGKYGMGLPTASVSQCKRLDIWTWIDGVQRACHCYIDIEQIRAGTLRRIPEPDAVPIPEKWTSSASNDAFNKTAGTLVVWSDPDRIVAQSRTIFDQLEDQIGRIYRWYIHNGELKIRMATLRPGTSSAETERYVRPNDPLYVMPNSSTPEPWDTEPMFRMYTGKSFNLNVDGREELVEVVYSIAKQEALGEFKGDLPGNRPYGRHARRSMGISVVRENREIALETFFNTEGGGGSAPQNRWWGCEVRFGSGCDDAFGLDHNKQMVSYFSRALKDLTETESETTSGALDGLGVGDRDVYEIASHIKGTVRAMMREIKRMFAARAKRGSSDNGLTIDTVEDEAVHLATKASQESINRGGAHPTQTDRDRSELNEGERTSQLTRHFVREGFSVQEAEKRVDWLIKGDAWFSIIPAELSGSQMFSFVSRGGVLNMSLNIHHPIYQFIQIIEQEAEEHGSEIARRSAVGLLAMLLSWGRMEDDIELDELRLQVQDRALHWGRMVRSVLIDLEAESTPTD